ncbi:hypothetical protein [Corynebacterium xerosis]|uniref:hypothetical protein n=1 Tax=Corynebacterium xerosis TaxID=1725 RepID=UPI0011AFAF73|nr:hypothetical protein [Corynebacterium xerosis]
MNATPSLAGYSPVPSMQMVATQHSSAIVGSSGCSVVVSAAIDAEIQWSAANLKSMVTALESHEMDTGAAFESIDPLNAPKKLQVADGIVHHAFGARPPFNPGNLIFTPAVVGPEAMETAESLLGKFTATNDAAVGDAIIYWSNYATRMTELASTLASAAGKIAADNEGAAFDAAAASLTGLAGRVGNVAASATIMVTHLSALPAVKAMAINVLGSIAHQSQAIPDAAAREAFERAEITAFVGGPYLGQLQTAVPTLPNLTQPDFSVSAPDLVASGINGGHGIAGASQVGLAPAGMTSAAAAPASAASSMAPATAGPISGHHGMPPAGGTPSTAPMTPSTSGPVPTLPGTSAPLTPSGATAPASINSGGAMPPAPTGMAPAGATSGTGGASGAGSRGASGIGNMAGLGGTGGTGGGRVGGPGAGGAGGFGNGAASRSRGGIGTGGHPVAGSGKTPSTTAVARTGPLGANSQGTASSTKTAGTAHALGAQRNGTHRGETNVGTIRGAGRDFEQDEYQRELFGDEPVTVPAVIGANVRG